jgi:hypothetical protein
MIIILRGIKPSTQPGAIQTFKVPVYLSNGVTVIGEFVIR